MVFLVARTWLTLLALQHAAQFAEAALDLGYNTDADLTNFITRPEIKAPVFNVTRRADVGVSPGYWFLAPYATIRPPAHPHSYYQACSTGAHIYDGRGELVWSSACKARNSNAQDFRLFQDESGKDRLSAIWTSNDGDLDGKASIMDSSYERIFNFTTPDPEPNINMHEFKVIEGGRSALYLTHQPSYEDITSLQLPNMTWGWVSNIGFREIDVATGQTIFEWWSKGQVSVTESTALPPKYSELAGPHPMSWNWFHANSVDKDSHGDYLLSGRFVDTVYKISQNGDIAWRLGGIQSDFVLEGFNFSKQHDARFLSNEGDIETISLFDNAKAVHPGLDMEGSSDHSSALIIALDKSTMTAKVIRRIARPDRALTRLRGNFQMLADGNAFVCWADNGYISEHGPKNELLLEAKFKSERFATYRGYKFNFTARPTEPPVMKAFVYGATPGTSSTVWYASWNGATEIAEWRFFRDANSTDLPAYVGSTSRSGFETMFSSDGFESRGFAEAVAKDGTVLGRTAIEDIALPLHWNKLSPSAGGADRSTGGAWSTLARLLASLGKDEL